MLQNPKDTYKKNHQIIKNKDEIQFITYPEINYIKKMPTELYIEHTLDIKTGNLKVKTYDDYEYFNLNTKSIPKWINHGIVVNLKEKYPDIYSILLQKETNQISQKYGLKSKLLKLFFNEINNKLKYPLFDEDLKPDQEDIWTKGSKEELLQDLTYLINQDKNVQTCQEWPVVIKINYESLEHKKLLYRVLTTWNLELSSKTQTKIEEALKKYAFKGHFYLKSQRDYNSIKLPNVTYLDINQLTPHEILDAGIKGKLL